MKSTKVQTLSEGHAIFDTEHPVRSQGTRHYEKRVYTCSSGLLYLVRVNGCYVYNYYSGSVHLAASIQTSIQSLWSVFCKLEHAM